MTVALGLELRNSLCELIRDRASNGALILYAGYDPHSDQLTEEIVRFPLAAQPFRPVESGTMAAAPIAPARCSRGGALRYWEIRSSPLHDTHPDQMLLRGSIGDITNPGDADLVLDTVAVLQNQAIAIASFTYSAPL
ncbi:hypothetical protein [Synechococcus elongatus]|uniref:ORF 3 n=2 Tax=Synechococcus elongatus TaxID=32046 RepID=Q57311_SYNE7|nr:hypothetical protein [Synechococcus elongatus]AAB05794.1 ORF 3 [Synechococcus elongatus PCC 7942 = FACHB-805]ABB57459.1 conserved hypothetical protein [Synechococcus elongatus PCC 7942 = FACHB-805]AJD58038.1 hypothetical protein M744_09445 [Synechococcus elongatus UTEX 2973]MBD2588506.1 hypothetical protein [Synechococcus elongatus FACHB-242]MBD2689574.1 hypothetical protein [Synechococcus elongatus FACHB-1061]